MVLKKTKISFTFSILFILLSLSPSYVSAKTFNVSNAAQFRIALESAALNGQDDTIILDAGTYKTTDDGGGTFKFFDKEKHDLIIKAKKGLTHNDVILDGDYKNGVFDYTNTKGAALVLDGITIKNGKAEIGGGVYCYSDKENYIDSRVTVTNSAIYGNSATDGGGFYCNASRVTVAGSSIFDNSATDGGAIYCDATRVTVTNSTIYGNTAAVSGGGIYCYVSSVTVANSTIYGNSSAEGRGGGIYCSGNVIITNSTISGNYAGGYSGGGGICSFGNVTVTKSAISENTVGRENGGGIYCAGVIKVASSTILENYAFKNGGGIYCYSDSDSNDESYVSVTNSTLSGNIAAGSGGAIYFYSNKDSYNRVTVTNSEIYGNTATDGRENGIYEGGTFKQATGVSCDFARSDFRLGVGPIAISKGLNPIHRLLKNDKR
ncbi:MAG: right-handed parallel beta-helix repeat-containing protein [Candidatus Schekmanbacteria bacterium]|nr:right-handed parallel beta-helix repeat-containing protein [Candidatus Schekmanbacteria bacterium]